MHIASFVISLLAGIFSFLQGGCSVVGAGVGSGLSEHVGGAEGAKMAEEAEALGAGGVLVAVAAILAIIGGSFALARKKAGYILLVLSTVLAFIALSVSNGIFKDAGIWGACYALAGIFAYVSYNKKQKLLNPPQNQDQNNTQAQ